MISEKRHLLKVLSILLQYPEEEWIHRVEELRDAVEDISKPGPQERCTVLLNYLAGTPLILLQENYTATFDLNPNTCLNLTYHRWGDARERGSALVAFHQLYSNAGYECATGELPDYLPMILEFLAVNGQEKKFSLLKQYSDQVEVIGSRLREAGSPYLGIVEIVVDICKEYKASGV